MSIANAANGVPNVKVWAQKGDGVEHTETSTLLGRGKNVLVGVPAAFSPTCNDAHLPGYILHADAFKKKGVSHIFVLAVNDFHTMKAWFGKLGVDPVLFQFIADLDLALTKALGTTLDLTKNGLGVRCSRLAIVLNNGKVVYAASENGPGLKESAAEVVLAHC